MSSPARYDHSDEAPFGLHESTLATPDAQPVLVASDGTALAGTAMRVATALAHRRGNPAVVVSALNPLAPSTIGIEAPLTFLPSGDIESRRNWDRTRVVAEQLRSAGGAPEWPIHTDAGDAATVIVAHAAAARAAMIVMGLRPHSPFARVTRDETTLRVMREATVPVLGVTESLTGLPKRIVAAVDFSRASLRAARLALSVASPDARIMLVCVQPEMTNISEELEGRQVILMQGVAGAFARLRQELDLPAGVAVETVVLEGSAASEILEFARRIDADLVTIGSHRRSLLNRVFLGSVTSAVVRAAQCSVLVVPPGASKH